MRMTINELRDALCQYPSTWRVFFTPLPLYWDGVHSYRGSYDEPACGYTTDTDVPAAVADVLKDLESLVTECFTGWKGGYFYYDGTQELHVACAGDVTNAYIGEVSSPFEGYVELKIVHGDD